MHECIYLIRTRDEARFVGQRLDRSFLPQVLERLCFFVLSDQRVYVAVELSAWAAPSLQQWARGILSECGDRCDPSLTLAQLANDAGHFSEVYLDRGEGFLHKEE